ncbi:thioredoxin family protein [Algoriphagus persicinus]|uniref:thioredoxin family protein n=1 Tax=Algoriphagus persicinus TaxID=3108754 RepID=UPI002B36B177|nr:thioredoxin fold domain-containing protein [Algoriphagus sp. E1-3-M2]MEB2786407.1 thioredoxin fold domain-containing protein [Algoriphagus sp. E1-3-M2]
MKKILIVGLILLSTHFAQAQDKIAWLKFEEAVAATEANPKMLLVDVYTDWCGWCKKMDKETFTDPDVIKYINEKFYAVKMNAEDDKRKFDFKGKDYTEAKMAAAMRVQSYPNFVIIDPTLKNITQLPGYRQPAEFLDGLAQIVDNGIGAK